MIARRAFIGTLGLGMLARFRHAHAQASAKPARVGWLSRSAGREAPSFKAFVEGLRELGYVTGENVVVDVRAPEHDRLEEYAELASRLVAAGGDVIIAANPHALEAMTKSTKTIPIVGVDFESDPVAKGWVASVARPSGNVTGFFLDSSSSSSRS
jgi:putative ABC transport system substrate-binding protein